MKKDKSEQMDELRPEYRRSDFGDIERGKYARRAREHTNIVLLDPEIADVFPDDEAVNKALHALIAAKSAAEQINLPHEG